MPKIEKEFYGVYGFTVFEDKLQVWWHQDENQDQRWSYNKIFGKDLKMEIKQSGEKARILKIEIED